MSKSRLLFASLFFALAVVLTYGAVAQQAAKAQSASQAKPATAGPAQKAAAVLPKVAKVTVNDPVTLTDNGDTWTLDNGIIKATILKKIGSVQQVMYHGIEMLQPSFQTGGDVYHTPPTPMGTQIPTWEQIPSGTVTPSVTIDPATNGGERAEVAVKGVNNGRMDIELRYTLERGQSGALRLRRVLPPGLVSHRARGREPIRRPAQSELQLVHRRRRPHDVHALR